MARSTHNDPQQQSTPELEKVSSHPSDSKGAQPAPGPPGSLQENLNLGHACLRSECWPGRTATDPDKRYWDSTPRLAMFGQARPPRRSPLRHPRPAQPAEARFTSNDYEFIGLSRIPWPRSS